MFDACCGPSFGAGFAVAKKWLNLPRGLEKISLSPLLRAGFHCVQTQKDSLGPRKSVSYFVFDSGDDAANAIKLLKKALK